MGRMQQRYNLWLQKYVIVIDDGKIQAWLWGMETRVYS